MNIQDLGSIGELVAAVATIATLFYLAVQIRESSRLSRRQALEHAVDRLAAWSGRLIENPDALKTYLEGLEGFESFDASQKYQYHFIMAEIFMIIESIRENVKYEAIKVETAEALDPRLEFELRGSGARAWWREMARDRFAKDFSAHVDRLIASESQG